MTEEELKDRFRPRGSDAFSASLPESAISPSFTKGDDRKYPYLSSRFLINPYRESFKEEGINRGRLNSRSRDKNEREQQRARQGVVGNPEYLKS